MWEYLTDSMHSLDVNSMAMPWQESFNKQTKGAINNYSSSPNGLWVNSPWGQRPKAEWAIDSEAMRNTIIVLVKSN